MTTDTKTKHTPGEWRTDYDDIQNSQTLIFTQEFGGASPPEPRMHFAIGGSAPKAELEANARLIAAAPKLLDVCKSALAAMEAGLTADDPLAFTQIEWEAEPLSTLRAVIAEAEEV
jgi:hypothetical protein